MMFLVSNTIILKKREILMYKVLVKIIILNRFMYYSDIHFEF